MITVVIRDPEGVTQTLTIAAAKLQSAEFWKKWWTPAMHRIAMFTRYISPVVTGSYRASHRTEVKEKTARIYIDPTARNTDSKILVTRYAGPVEARHAVYRQTFDAAPRFAIAVLEGMAEELIP